MKIWLCLVLFMCLDLATSLKCHKCKNGCAQSEEVDCPQTNSPLGDPYKLGCLEQYTEGKLNKKECINSGNEIVGYTCRDEAFQGNGGTTVYETSCSCGEDLCNSNMKPQDGMFKDDGSGGNGGAGGGGGGNGGAGGGGGGSGGSGSGVGGPIVPWNNLLWIGLGLAFFIIH